jgi:imidazolonepropionase-like amidohydrolase
VRACGWAGCAVIALLGSARLHAQSDSVVEEGTFRLHKFKQPIGDERYRVLAQGHVMRLTTAFEFADRGTPVRLDAALDYSADLTPRHFEVKGNTSRQSRIDVAIDLVGATARVRSDSSVRDTMVTSPAFLIAGYAPIAMQQAIVRFWEARGRPDTVRTLPSGWVHVVDRGSDTLAVGSDRVELRRFGVDGLIWGRETLWFDGSDRLVAAVTIDAEFDHLEAIREGYETALPAFVSRAASDQAQALATAVAGSSPKTDGTFALVGATLIDGSGAPPVPDAVVVVRDGRIVAAGPRASTSLPAGIPRVDAGGKTVLPGLWDMHAHYEQVEWGPIYLASGVTSVRDVGNEFEFVTAVRNSIESGIGIGPRMVLAGIVDGSGPEGVGVDKADTPAEGTRIVQRYHRAGFRQMKIYSSVSLPVLRAVAREAHVLGMTVTGHIPRTMDVYQAVSAGMDQVNHLTYIYAVMRPPKPDSGTRPPLDLSSSRAQRAIAFLRERHVVLDPTMSLFEWLDHPARVPYSEIEPGVLKVPPSLAGPLTHAGVLPEEEAQAAESFRDLLAVLEALHRAGVPIVAGTDQVVPGYSLHRELELYVKAGFTPMEAIQAATIEPAKALGLERETGTIARGKRADMVVIDGDPLAEIANLRKVWLVVANGQQYRPAPLWRSVGFEP